MWEQSGWILWVAPESSNMGMRQWISTRVHQWPYTSCLTLRLHTATVYEASKHSQKVDLSVRDVHLSTGQSVSSSPISIQAPQERTGPSPPCRNFWFLVFHLIWEAVSQSAYLCSITLLLGTSFQNWVNSAGPVPDDCSISAAIIRNRSWAETLKPVFQENKVTYEHQLSWG